MCLRGRLRISAPTVLFAQSQGKMFKTKYISRQIGSGRNKRFEGFLLGRLKSSIGVYCKQTAPGTVETIPGHIPEKRISQSFDVIITRSYEHV